MPPSFDGHTSKWGWTEESLRDMGYTGRVSDLTREQAKAYTRKRFGELWVVDLLSVHTNQTLAFEMLEFAFNAGEERATLALQNQLNALNYDRKTGKPYVKDLIVDGVFGAKTRTLLFIVWARSAYISTVLPKGIDGEQASFYASLATRSIRHRKHYLGWVNKRIGTYF